MHIYIYIYIYRERERERCLSRAARDRARGEFGARAPHWKTPKTRLWRSTQNCMAKKSAPQGRMPVR